jgi:predicted nucleic acid-binding protein
VSPTDVITIVITDSSIVINLSHTGHLRLLGATDGFRFAVPDEVVAEITKPAHRLILEGALGDGTLGKESLSSPRELEIYADLSQVLGSGESACLALALQRGWIVASDERRVFLREARDRLGAARILNTAGLYVLWIRQGLLTVDQADAAKQLLEAHRFRMAFKSFRDVI